VARLSEARWLPRAWRLHSALLTGGCLAISAFAAGSAAPSLAAQLAILAPCVLVLGVPHGALDAAAGERLLAPRLGERWQPAFLALYLALAGSVVLAWWWRPGAALAVFLAVSLVHFGACDRDPTLSAGAFAAFETAARGAIAVALPAALHPEEVASLFAVLIPGSDAATLAARMNASAVPVATIVFASAVAVAFRHASRVRRHGGAAARAGLEPLALCLACAALPPLLFFALFFCAGHSVRQTLVIAGRLDPHDPARALRRFIRGAAPMTVGAWLLLAAAAWLVPAPSMDVAAVRTVFVGLAALTLPHVVFEAAAQQRAPRRRTAEA
jgi:Brp/Blh family beta-carotene 15,15'-monooxygenase